MHEYYNDSTIFRIIMIKLLSSSSASLKIKTKILNCNFYLHEFFAREMISIGLTSTSENIIRVIKLH